MRSLAIADTSALYASLDRRDAEHSRCADILRRRELQIVIPLLVVAEVAYFADTRLGPGVESAFVRSLAGLDVEAPTVEDWPLIADLVERYANFPLGTTDAATVVLADRLGTDLVVTLDRRHFGTVQSPKGRHFRLLPETIAVHEEPAMYDGAPS